MSKRLLLTTAVGLILGTAAFAQTSTDPSKKTDTNKPVAQQTEKAKPQSRVEKWQADKQTEAAEKSIDKNTGTAQPNNAPSNSAQTSPSQTTPSQPAANTTQSQTPAANTGNTANQAQNNAPSTATTTTPNAGAPNAQPQNQQTQNNQPATNTPANAQPATNQAQTPNAAPATPQSQQAQQPQNGNTNAASTNNTSTQTSISAGVSVTDPQRTRISESVTKLNVQPVTKVNFSVSIGTVVSSDIRLHPVPAEVVEIVPQYRDYKFFLVREEIVIVEPSTMKIVTVLPRNGGATASTTTSTQTSSTTTQRKTTLSDSERATIKKNASQPRRERAATTRIERDDPRSARAEAPRELRVGDRVPSSVELHEMPERAYREAPTLREYRYMSRGSRTYVIEPRERTIIEELD